LFGFVRDDDRKPVRGFPRINVLNSCSLQGIPQPVGEVGQHSYRGDGRGNATVVGTLLIYFERPEPFPESTGDVVVRRRGNRNRDKPWWHEIGDRRAEIPE